jgi:protoporphyrinogen oxidase
MKKKAIIVGGGITGLSAAWKLSENGYLVKIIEKEDFVGGMATTFKYKDYFLDYGPHKIFTVLEISRKRLISCMRMKSC